MTKIIATIGPTSEDEKVLKYFASHSTDYARLNFSHGTSDWHQYAGEKARNAGLKLLFDLPGPKIRLGIVDRVLEIKDDWSIILEFEKKDTDYPYNDINSGKNILVFPYQFPIQNYMNIGDQILIDDGKLELKVEKLNENRIFCRVVAGGLVKSRKGMNLPNSHIKVDFLRDRDKQMLNDLLIILKPEIVAASFVQSSNDILQLKEFMKHILSSAGIFDYFPMICTKVEMQKAVDDENLESIVENSDLIMIARGDLALETAPAHIMVPFYQDKIIEMCKSKNKPFIVATQILESMIETPVPTRAEVSDLYRAIKLNKANFVMLSGESASGKYPEKCVELMDKMIKM